MDWNPPREGEANTPVSNEPTMPEQAAIRVVSMAMPALPLAATAEPTVKPNQPPQAHVAQRQGGVRMALAP